MTLRFRNSTARAARSAGLALAVLLGAQAGVQAAVLDVAFTDAAGAPLGDAVAMLEPANGKVAVKPMADAEISQSKRQFNPRVTLVTTGTRITFPNFDTVRHHVYSFSPIKTFELKLYAGVPNLPVVFDKPGVGVLGCNIHDSMAAWVVVSDTPWAARSPANGHARIDGVPAGNYKLRTWHPGLPADTEPPPVAVTVGAGDTELPVRLAVKAAP